MQIPEDMVELTRQLIRNACVNDGSPESGNERRSVDTVLEFLDGIGPELEVIEPSPGRASVVARLPGTDPDAPSFAMVGHLDVVPVTDAHAWMADPFGGEIIDGEIVGRGAIDMLSLTSSYVGAFRRFATGPERLKGDLILAAVADEEAGGRFGTGWIAQNAPEKITATYAITENGGISIGPADRPAITVTVGEKGSAARRLNFEGRSGHGSTPWRARNAAFAAAKAISRMSESPGEPHLLEHWHAIVAAMDLPAVVRERLLDPARIMSALDELGELASYGHAVSHMTVSPNIVRAGEKSNVIPGEATIDLDIRLLPGQGAEEVDRYLGTILEGLDAWIEGDRVNRASVSSSDTELYRAIETSVRARFPGADMVPVIMPGGTDGRHLRALGSVVYGFGLYSPSLDMASFRQRFHGRDERIDLESIALINDSLDDVIRALLG